MVSWVLGTSGSDCRGTIAEGEPSLYRTLGLKSAVGSAMPEVVKSTR